MRIKVSFHEWLADYDKPAKEQLHEYEISHDQASLPQVGDMVDFYESPVAVPGYLVKSRFFFYGGTQFDDVNLHVSIVLEAATIEQYGRFGGK
jgi:hypothetical protein